MSSICISPEIKNNQNMSTDITKKINKRTQETTTR